MTLDALKNHLNTAAWKKGLSKTDSPVSKVLLSDAFKNPVKGQSAQQIDVEYLTMFGLLHCQDLKCNANKNVAFYDILNEGGMERHTHISAGDKDLKPCFVKMCQLVTCELFDFSHLKISYSDDEKDQLKEAAELVLEDEWLEEMYGP